MISEDRALDEIAKICGCPHWEYPKRVSQQWRTVALEWQEWADTILAKLGLQPEGGKLGDSEAMEAIGRLVAPAKWYIYDPELGFEEYTSKEDAKEAAEQALEHHHDNAGDGWHSDIESLEWGMMVPVERAKIEASPAPDGSSFDEFWDVSLEEVEP